MYVLSILGILMALLKILKTMTKNPGRQRSLYVILLIQNFSERC